MKKILIFLFVLSNGLIYSQGSAAVRAIRGQIQSEFEDQLKKESKDVLRNTWERLGKITGNYKSAKEMYAGLQALKKGECLPDYSVNPQAMVPSICVDTGSESTQCIACYREAYTKLSDARRRLGRLKCMGLTMKNFIAKQISFGDNASSIHAIHGLTWQHERKGITDSYSKFKDAYDTKYKELMDKLNESMMTIDACESQNGQKDWYQRFGFMYVEFMSEKYKRSE